MVIFNSYVSLPEGKTFSNMFKHIDFKKKTSEPAESVHPKSSEMLNASILWTCQPSLSPSMACGTSGTSSMDSGCNKNCENIIISTYYLAIPCYTHDPCMLYMVTFTIIVPPMLAYIAYMDPMGYISGGKLVNVGYIWENMSRLSYSHSKW